MRARAPISNRKEKELFLTAGPIWLLFGVFHFERQRTHKIFKLCALFILPISTGNFGTDHSTLSLTLFRYFCLLVSLILVLVFHISARPSSPLQALREKVNSKEQHEQWAMKQNTENIMKTKCKLN